MLDFSLTEEQIAFRDTVKKFAEKKVKPIAVEADKMQDPKEGWSLVGPVVKKALQLGFGKILIPEEYGGLGWGLIELEILGEELAVADAGISLILLGAAGLPGAIAKSCCTKDQKEKWLRPSGEDLEGKHIWAGACTEPTGGDEIICPLPDPSFGVRTTATRDREGYRIKGQKCFVTNASVAEDYLVLARTRKDKPNLEGCNLFFFHKDTPGYHVGKIEEKLGMKTMRNGEIFFDDMWVPKEDMIGEEGGGFLELNNVLKGNCVAAAGMSIGLARAAYNDALSYAQERIIWGKPIIQYEAVASKLVRMRMKIEACKAFIMKLIWTVENPSLSKGLINLTSMAKLCSSEMVEEVCNDAMYIFGGYGYMKDYPVEKYFRDSLVPRLGEGANETIEWLMSFNLQRI